MKNLKKLGLTALAGSLAAVSAQAGELGVSGSTQMTYVKGESSKSAGAFGHASGFTLSGSGDLDNGWSVAHSIAYASGGGFSEAATTLTMGSLGSIAIGSATSINGGYDEPLSTAYEEATDGTTTGSNVMDSMGSFAGNGLVYKAPALDIMGASVAIGAEYTTSGNGTQANNGGDHARNDAKGKAYGLGVTITTDMGLKVGAYGAEMANDTAYASTARAIGDRFDGTWFAEYAMGPISIGYQTSYVDSGLVTTVETTGAAKTVGTSGGIFDGEAISIAFNVNDDLSVSYTENEETYDAQDNASTTIADVTQSIESLQVAYSMGSMSVKAYSTETTNANFVQNADKRTVTEIAVGIAF
jgi:outer membrane protein OmpU